MRLHKFFVKNDLNEKSVFVENIELLRQIKNVLRLKVGDEIILSDGRLNEAVCKITAFQSKSFSVFVLDRRINTNEPKNHTILYLSILKKENFEIAVQKATEVGIKEIVPIVSKRTIKFGIKFDRLRKVIQEAAEQSNRGVVPQLHESLELEKAIINAKENNLNIFFHPVGGPIPNTKEKNRIGIFIGPEGGWDESEILLAKNYNFVLAKMAPLSFRAETAAVVASFLISQNY